MIDDVHTKGFTYNTSSKVPSLSDSDLTYESGDAKKGKCIETCVLFVDIRNRKHNHHSVSYNISNISIMFSCSIQYPFCECSINSPHCFNLFKQPGLTEKSLLHFTTISNRSFNVFKNDIANQSEESMFKEGTFEDVLYVKPFV